VGDELPDCTIEKRIDNLVNALTDPVIVFD